MAHQYSYVRIHAYFAVMFIITSLVVLIMTPVVVVVSSSWPIRDQYDPLLLSSLLAIDHETKLFKNTSCIKNASSDYGNIVKQRPLGVLYPSSVSDISNLVKSCYNSSSPFTIAAHGNGHSVRGQAMAKNDVVVDMESLNTTSDHRIMVSSGNSSVGYYADVGGEQLWIDVLRATLSHGLAPVSWTDYLYLTVGGTLSNAGISGQASFHGPQIISNVLEMDVITGKGNLITCSKKMNSDMFYAVLGGLGQFGIITRARIVLDKEPTRVKWIRIIYDDFSSFTKDQEHFISSSTQQQHAAGSTLFDYVEGSLIVDTTSTNNFYCPSDATKLNSLILAASNNDDTILYTLEAVKYYHNDDDPNINTTAIIDEELERILDRVLNLKSRLMTFKKDVSFFDFLNRLGKADDDQEKPKNVRRHPWLNLFVPGSRITDFNQGVFVEILQKQQGPYLVYPINRKRWDDRMSVVIPDDDEDMFYTVGLLHLTEGDDDWSKREEQNKEILEFCYKNDIKIKQYFPSYTKKEDWMKHFGKKWDIFRQRKNQFDPKMILSPGQRIFSSD